MHKIHKKKSFDEGGTIDGPGDPEPRIFKTKEEREQARINFEKVAKKALSTPNDDSYLFKFGSVYDPQKKRDITQDDSEQCINGICGLYEAAGINYNAGGFGQAKRYIGNGTFFDNVMGKKEDIYMTTSPKAMDHLQYTSTRQTKDGKIVKYPTHSKAVYAVENGDLKVIHNGGGKEFYYETLDINNVKQKIKNGDIIAYRYGRQIDKQDLELEKKAGMSPEVLAGIEKQKLEKKKKEVKNETYRKLLADNPNTVMEQIDNFNDYSINESKINRNESLLNGKKIGIKDLAISIDGNFFQKGIGKHLMSTLNDESRVFDISEKYGISPFEASKLLRQAMGVAITESRGGKPTGASAVIYGIEEMLPETLQRKRSVGPYQIRYNTLNKKQKEKVGNSKELYTEETSTDALLDILMENKKYLDNRLKQKRTKDIPGLTKENVWDYAPMLMNQLNKGKVNDTGFKYNTRAGQIKYIADNLLTNTGKIKDRTKTISNGKK